MLCSSLYVKSITHVPVLASAGGTLVWWSMSSSKKLTVQGRWQTHKQFRQKEKQTATAVIGKQDSEGAEGEVDWHWEKSVYPERERAAGEGRKGTWKTELHSGLALQGLGCFCERQQFICGLTPLCHTELFWSQPSRDVTNSRHHEMIQ